MTRDQQVDLAEVGRALASIQTIIRRMLNKAELAHLTESCAAELQAPDHAVRALAPTD